MRPESQIRSYSGSAIITIMSKSDRLRSAAAARDEFKIRYGQVGEVRQGSQVLGNCTSTRAPQILRYLLGTCQVPS